LSEHEVSAIAFGILAVGEPGHLSLGPLTVAVLTDHVFGRPASLGYALACTDGAGALAAIVAFLVSRRRFSAQRH
jgi:hypothetical protein